MYDHLDIQMIPFTHINVALNYDNCAEHEEIIIINAQAEKSH